MSASTRHDPTLVTCTYGELQLPVMDARQAIDMAQGYLTRAKALSRVLWCAAGSDMEPDTSEVIAVTDLLADLIEIANSCVQVVAGHVVQSTSASGGAA